MTAVLAPKTALVWIGGGSSTALYEETCVDFFGIVVNSLEDLPGIAACTRVYLAGDVETVIVAALALVPRDSVFCVDGVSTNTPTDWSAFVSPGMLPRLVPGIGVFYPCYFNARRDFFREFSAHHVASTLTESNKVSSVSYRKGVYITSVLPTEDGAGSRFRLLRCSTNFSSPTENCRTMDDDIIHSVNDLACACYDGGAELNHVLAQVYTNSTVSGKDKKARIPDHSDKTKDMPRNALMAFVTFYDFDPEAKYNTRGYDVLYHDTSVLTTLMWKEKGGDRRRVSITLYPGSVLFVNMDTNRLWTHEIRPSSLPVDKLPTRLGYVVRCSKTVAVHTADGDTCIEAATGELVPLRKPTHEDMSELKAQYARENATAEWITYGDIVPYSMNTGDYMRPLA